MTKMNINTFADRFIRGEFLDSDVKTQIEAGWYDWFCSDTSLVRKTQSLGRKVLQLMKSDKIDTDAQFVFFKNNCPVYGRLYDDFRITDMETGDVIYTIIPSSGYKSTQGQSQVWGRENDFQRPLVAGTWKDVKAFFGV